MWHDWQEVVDMAVAQVAFVRWVPCLSECGIAERACGTDERGVAWLRGVARLMTQGLPHLGQQTGMAVTGLGGDKYGW